MGKQLQFELWRECNSRCTYCVPGDTDIIMGDYTRKKIKDINVGDEILSFDRDKKKYVKAKVLATNSRHIDEPIYQIDANGNCLKLTKNHLIATNRNKWIEPKYMYTNKEQIVYTSNLPISIEYDSDEYKIGYIIGCMLGDGVFKNYRESEHNTYIGKDGKISHKGSGIQVRFAIKDEDITNRLQTYFDYFKIPYGVGKFHFISENIDYWVKSLRSANTNTYNIIQEFIDTYYTKSNNKEYLRGFLAGAYDCEGSLNITNGTIRITNMGEKYYNEMKRGIKYFNIPFVEEMHETKNFSLKYATIRLWAKSVIPFINTINPACIRKRWRIEKPSREIIHMTKVDNIEPINYTGIVYNIQTECETYIANNILVHNCYLGTQNLCTPVEYKIESLDKAYEKICDMSLYPEYDTLAFIGGEFFQGQLNTPEVKDKFMKLMDKTAWLYNNGYIKHVWIYATMTIGDQKDLYETIERFNKKEELWILTSYDTIGRFHTPKMEETWKYHMKNIHKLYPEIKLNTTTILTQDFINKYLNDEFSVTGFMEEFNTATFLKPCCRIETLGSKEEINQKIPGFYPTRDSFLQFLIKFRNQESEQMYDKLFNINYRADSLYRNFNDGEHMRLTTRHKDTYTETVQNNDGNDKKCGHSEGYSAYIDSDGCAVCDKEMIRNMV